jgi:hypothetical protein
MKSITIAGIVLAIAHVAAVLWHFPLRHAHAADPLATGDLSITLGKAWDAAALDGHIGYSPNYMAGYMVGSWNRVGHRGYELGATYLPFGSGAANYYWTVVGMAMLTPLLLAIAAWIVGSRGVMVCAVLGVASIVVQLCDPISYFWTFGNTGFVFASAAAVLAMALALPRDGKIRNRRALAAGIIAGVTVVLHTVAVVPVAMGGLAAILASRREGLSWRHILRAALLATGIAVAIAAPTYWHLFSQWDQRARMTLQPLPSGVKYLIMDIFSDRAYGHATDRRPMFHALLVLAAWAGIRDWRARSGPAAGLTLAGVIVLGFGYAAGHIPLLKELQPYRFVVSGELFLVVPATLGIAHMITAIRAANPLARPAIIALLVMIIPAHMGYLWDLTSRHRAGGLDAASLACANWFRNNPHDGRVLCEPGGLGALFPHLTGRPVIGGGVSSQAVVIQNWAHVDGGRAFGKPLSDVSAEEFVRLLRAFDIRDIVTESPAFDDHVRKLPVKLTERAAFGNLKIYQLEPGQSDVIWDGVAAGQVTAQHNVIRIDRPPVGRIVIPYHFVDGLRSDPGVVIEAHWIPGAAAPFMAITIPDLRASVELRFAGR